MPRSAKPLPTKRVPAPDTPPPLAIVVHDLQQALAARQHNFPVITAPGAAQYLGLGYVMALDEPLIVDCGDDAALALEGIRLGIRALICTTQNEGLLMFAAQQNAMIYSLRPAKTLDLRGVKDVDSVIARWAACQNA